MKGTAKVSADSQRLGKPRYKVKSRCVRLASYRVAALQHFAEPSSEQAEREKKKRKGTQPLSASVVFSLNTHKNILIYRRYAALSGARLSGVDKRLGVVSVTFYKSDRGGELHLELLPPSPMRPKLKCSLCFSQFSIKKQSVLQSNPSSTTLVVPSCTMFWCTALGACTLTQPFPSRQKLEFFVKEKSLGRPGG